MKRVYVPERLRRKVEAESRYRCAYCLTQQDIIGQIFHIEHIIPRVAGGATVIENLCLSCALCNDFKGMQTHAADPIQTEVILCLHPSCSPS
jgi:5-methylcytosine-specific restriction endonuclease McrA